MQRALTEEDGEGQPAHRQQALTSFSRELLVAEQEYQAFLDDRGGGIAEGGPAAWSRAPSKIQARLAGDEAVLEYVVGRDTLMVFVVTARG